MLLSIYVDLNGFYIDYIEASAPQHPYVISILKILSSDIFACVALKQQRNNIFIVDFLQRHRLLKLERFNGPVGGYQVVELPSPWL